LRPQVKTRRAPPWKRLRSRESDVRELLGFETRMEVHGFLKEHGVFLHYGVEDLDHDLEVARQLTGLPPTQRGKDLPGGRRAG
jgi:Uncharacterised protein family (UPF0175)